MAIQEPRWEPTDYGPIAGSGARKLADSAVAPLVALARGYSSVSDQEGAKKLAARATVPDGAIVRQRELVALVQDDEDILVMPWYAVSQVVEDGVNAKSYNTQYRPSRVVRDARNKVQKYKWFKGEHIVLDLHPATPVEWVDNSLTVLLTEGLLKGDSALTASLLASGVPRKKLAAIADTTKAREELHKLMLAVPKEKRVLVVTSASVTTWSDQAAQWRHLTLRERRVIVAFDGDLASNPMVWQQTQSAMSFFRDRKANPVILSLFSPEMELAKAAANLPAEEKLGIDDYLSKIGNWDTLCSLIKTELPPKPESTKTQYEPGAWRVHPDNEGIVQEYVAPRTPDGFGTPEWVNRYFIGGRVVSTIARRRPTEMEIRTGLVDEKQEMFLDDSLCEIEIMLADPELGPASQPVPYRFTGPVTLLSLPPRDWHKHATVLPNELLQHPHWPPRKGEDWLGAIKAHRRDEIDTAIAYHAMGWVPVPNGQPAFIVGNQVLGATERDEQSCRIGVTDRVLPRASMFGVMDTFRTMPLEQYRKQVADDIRTVIQLFIENGFWRQRSTAITVVAAMLRPTIPLRPDVTVYITGSRGSGKTYTASYVMSGWQALPGTWNAHSLPGAANDTAAAMEHALAHTPIWVVDDLAPQVDQRQSDGQESAIAQVIRGVHNNSSRRRMDGRTMTQREVASPTALLVVTAENPPQVSSIEQRIISIRVPKGSFNDDNPELELALKREVNSVDGGAPARLTAAMIRFWQHGDCPLGATWAERQARLREVVSDETTEAVKALEERYGIPVGESARFAAQVSSLGVSLQVLYMLALWAGISPTDPILAGFGNHAGSYMDDLYQVAARSIHQTRESSPGRALVRALSKTLAGGYGHIRNALTPGAPPIAPREGDPAGAGVGRMNEALGWFFDPAQNTWKPKGVAIGYFGTTTQGDEVIVFDTAISFDQARKHFPSFIPHGQTSTASWEAVWTEGIGYSKVTPRSNAVSARVTVGSKGEKSTRINGIPIPLNTILGIDGGDEDEAV